MGKFCELGHWPSDGSPDADSYVFTDCLELGELRTYKIEGIRGKVLFWVKEHEGQEVLEISLSGKYQVVVMKMDGTDVVMKGERCAERFRTREVASFVIAGVRWGKRIEKGKLFMYHRARGGEEMLG